MGFLISVAYLFYGCCLIFRYIFFCGLLFEFSGIDVFIEVLGIDDMVMVVVVILLIVVWVIFIFFVFVAFDGGLCTSFDLIGGEDEKCVIVCGEFFKFIGGLNVLNLLLGDLMWCLFGSEEDNFGNSISRFMGVFGRTICGIVVGDDL